jgi:hypothetical protein
VPGAERCTPQTAFMTEVHVSNPGDMGCSAGKSIIQHVVILPRGAEVNARGKFLNDISHDCIVN